MEDWEIKHIDQNLPSLIQNTRCTTVLKAWLKGKNFITTEDEEILTALESHYGLQRAAKELYEIMKTRVGGFKALKDVLLETQQTGALTVLSSQSLTQSELLLQLRVRIAGKVCILQDMFPAMTVSDAAEILQDTEINDEFCKILETEPDCFPLDRELPKPDKLHIPRYLSNCLLLNPDVFQIDCPDVFVFQGINRNDLVQLVKPHVTRSSTSQRSKITCRHIYLDDEEDWDDMVEVRTTPIHLISKQGGDYVLERSIQTSSVIFENSLNVKYGFISEDKAADQLLATNDAKGALICDVAGMGKTWLLQSIAMKLKTKSEKFAVFFVPLAHFSETLEAQDVPKGQEDALSVILQYACNSKLAVLLLQKHVRKNNFNIVFALDGFDEIRDVRVAAATSFLKDLNQIDNLRLVISSRPEMRSQLERTFQLVSYDILGFERKDQVKAIVEHWMASISHSNEEKLQEFAENCIDIFLKIQNNDRVDILGVPLKCYLLAAINRTRAEQICKPSRRKDIHVNEAVIVESISDLYKRFVDVSVKKLFDAQGKLVSSSTNESISVFHTLKSLELLFPEFAKTYNGSVTVDATIETLVAKVGVLYYSGNNNLQFIHRSFAEYFAGKFFADFWMKFETHEPGFARAVSGFFFKTVLRTTVRNFSNMLSYVEIKPAIVNVLEKFKTMTKASFHYFSVLWFINSVFKGPIQLLDGPESIFVREKKLITSCRAHFRAEVFVALLASIDEDLTSVLSLLVQLLKTFFGTMSSTYDTTASLTHLPSSVSKRLSGACRKYDWLIPPAVCTGELATYIDCCVPLLLCWVALKGTPESAKEIFDIFGNSERNCMLRYCLKYPQEYVSPLDIAILKNDADMVLYLLDKIHLTSDRILFTCLSRDGLNEDSNVLSKVSMMEKVFTDDDATLNILGNVDFKSQLDLSTGGPTSLESYIDLNILMHFSWKRAITSRRISVQNMELIFENVFCSYNDNEMMRLLLWVFGKWGYETFDVTKTIFMSDLPSTKASVWSDVTVEAFLDALDLEYARDIMSEMYIKKEHCYFENVESVETLEIFTKIQLHACWNEDPGFMHMSAYQGKIHWLEFLIKSGHDVNQRDVLGDTPLLSISWKRPIEVTKFLVDNGAHICARNDMEENVAHVLFGSRNFYESKDISDWITFTFDNYYGQLWRQKDCQRRTPFQTLTQFKSADDDDPLTNAIQKLLAEYSIYE